MTFLFSYTMFFALYTDRITVMKKGGKGETIVHFIGISLEYKSEKFICSLIAHILRQRKNIPKTLICVSIIVYGLLIFVANIFINNMVKMEN